MTKAVDAFKEAARAIPIDGNIFPRSLRPAMDEAVLATIRYLPHQTIPSYDLPPNVLAELASVLPFLPNSLEKLVCKRIMPLISASLQSELAGHYERLRELVIVARDKNSNDVPSSDAATLFKLFSDDHRRELYEIIRHENDLALLANVLNCFHQKNAAESEAPPTDSGSSSSVPISILSPTFRKALYRKILDKVFVDIVGAEAVSTSTLSQEFQTYKRKVERQNARLVLSRKPSKEGFILAAGASGGIDNGKQQEANSSSQQSRE